MGRMLGLVVALLLLAPAGAMASHMGQYRTNPVEHDAQGAIAEPDGLTTGVLGPQVTNCVLDLAPFEGRCTPDPVPKPSGALGDVIAPGCTSGNNERRLDGQCGLWTIGAGAALPAPAGVVTLLPGTVGPPLGETGMAGNAAPGAYTPTKTSTIRFLDGVRHHAVQPPAGGTFVLENNRKLQELERLAGLDLVVSRNVLPVQQYLPVWYGEWTDRNGNGVVDHVTPGSAGPTQNEFTWLGSCVAFGNPIGPRNPAAIEKGLCREEGNPNIEPPGVPCENPASAVGCTGSTIHTWLFPGNHHAGAPAADMPGNWYINWLFCGLDIECANQMDQDEFGDPLFGSQNNVTEDMTSHERTGDDDDSARQWAGGGGWTTHFYGDDGLLVTLVEVFGVNCGPGTANRFALTGPKGCTFTDVDRQLTINKDVQRLLIGPDPSNPNGGLKRTARYLLVDPNPPVDTPTLARKIDSVTGSRDLYVATQGPLQGNVDDEFLASGFSREPNHAADRYVGVEYGPCSALPVGDPRNPTANLDFAELEAQHAGFCNKQADGGAPYDSYRGAVGRGYIDARPARHLVYSTPINPGVPGCFWCLSGSLVGFPLSDVEPNGLPSVNGDVPPKFLVNHQRTLGPGMYTFGGFMGIWRDFAHTMDESLFPDPPLTTLETYPADGWIGMVQRDGGQWRYRGFTATACTTEKGTGVFEAAECNPYLDGNVGDPHNDAVGIDGEKEFQNSCTATYLAITLAPTDGSLDTQIIVWRAYTSGIAPDPLDINGDGHTGMPELEYYGPGPVAPLRLGMGCFQTNDYLIWPEGNRGDDIVTRVTHPISLNVDTNGDGAIDFDVVTDVDRYADWEPL